MIAALALFAYGLTTVTLSRQPQTWSRWLPEPSPQSATKGNAAAERSAILGKLDPLSVQYKWPEKLFYKRSEQVVFVLEVEGEGTSEVALSAVPGSKEKARVEVGRYVQAKLYGAADKVKISLRGGEAASRQFARLKNVEWVWDVEGLQSGLVLLTIQLTSDVDLGGSLEPVYIKSFKKRIPIEITVLETCKIWATEAMEFWPFLTAAGSAAVAFLSFFGLKRTTGSKVNA
ncbi:hypothetical protein [Methylobacterium sp. R2-1]|uniref:hypothetical protein n=1 Tax=Methylobacterium sp. R2-1 TaxID=2587064 RepID=UPI00161F6950|nr:hypothetical protein [Methylobacterium sp. R2-1]MBB2965089.1 hypothetical protein [Methylobacterium sp. R2-1]